MVTAVGITTDEEDEEEKLLKAEGKNTEDEETWEHGRADNRVWWLITLLIDLVR